MADDLVTWFLEQVDEDQNYCEREDGGGCDCYNPAGHSPDCRAFIRAECDAKRQIVAMYQNATERVKNLASTDARWAARCEQFALEATLRLLALPYATASHLGRPGYRKEWAPLTTTPGDFELE